MSPLIVSSNDVELTTFSPNVCRPNEKGIASIEFQHPSDPSARLISLKDNPPVRLIPLKDDQLMQIIQLEFIQRKRLGYREFTQNFTIVQGESCLSCAIQEVRRVRSEWLAMDIQRKHPEWAPKPYVGTYVYVIMT